MLESMNKEGFIRKKVKTLTLGERLEKTREYRGKTLADVSKVTGIQGAYLEYLEKGMFENLPAEVYVRGFIRRYAEYLGLPDQSLIRQYERERGMSRSLQNAEKGEQEILRRGAFRKIPSAVITPSRIGTIVFLFAVVAGFFYVYHQYRLFISEPVLVITEPTQETFQIEASFLFVAGKTDIESQVFINDQPVLVDEKGEFREKVDLQEGINVMTVRSVNRFSKEAKKVYTINVRSSRESIVPESAPSDVSAGKRVFIRIGERSVWVLIAVDGEQKVSTIAPSGSQWEFFPEREMQVSVGDGKEVFATIGSEGREQALSDKRETAEFLLDFEEEIFVPKGSVKP